VIDTLRVVIHIDSTMRDSKENRKGNKKENKKDINSTRNSVDFFNETMALSNWAEDSVGLYLSYSEESNNYSPIPKIVRNNGNKQQITDLKLAGDAIEYISPCWRVMERMLGNRSCFDKCK
jgi:hypothetical protein